MTHAATASSRPGSCVTCRDGRSKHDIHIALNPPHCRISMELASVRLPLYVALVSGLRLEHTEEASEG